MADGPVLRSKPLGGADCPPQLEMEMEKSPSVSRHRLKTILFRRSYIHEPTHLTSGIYFSHLTFFLY